MYKDLETSRVWLFLNHAVPSAVQNKAQNRLEKESRCIRIISELMLNPFQIRDALIYFPSPSYNLFLLCYGLFQLYCDNFVVL